MVDRDATNTEEHVSDSAASEVKRIAFSYNLEKPVDCSRHDDFFLFFSPSIFKQDGEKQCLHEGIWD